MAFLPIYNCFHPVLKKKTQRIEDINEELEVFIDNMFETMYESDGVGLAANQVGESKSLVVIDIAANTEAKPYPPIVMINPIITAYSDEEVEFQEGCLSVPTIHEIVKRPEAIEVTYLDQKGKEIKVEANDYIARVMQHEIDHLNGALFYEKLTAMRRTLIKSRLRKIQKGDILADYPMIDAKGKLVE